MLPHATTPHKSPKNHGNSNSNSNSNNGNSNGNGNGNGSMSAAAATPIKSPCSSPSSTAPLSMLIPSPRLRSPRGSSPRNNPHGHSPFSWIFSMFRHSQGMLTVAAVCAVWMLRPSVDPAMNLGAFVDPYSFDYPSVGGVATTAGGVQLLAPEDRLSDSYDHEEEEDSEEDQDVNNHSTDDELDGSTTSSSSYHSPLSAITATFAKQSAVAGSLSTYDAKRFPVVKFMNASVDVHLVVDISAGASFGPQSKFFLDGLERSPRTNVMGMTFLNPNVHTVQIQKRRRESQLIWIVDWGSMHRDCHRLERVLQTVERKPKDFVLLLDYSGSTRQTPCSFWDAHTRLAKRTIVGGRHYNLERHEIHAGHIAENTAQAAGSSGPVLHAPLVVRERFVAALLSNAKDGNPMKSTRDTDVCFFWKRGDYSHYGFWRRDVSNFIKRMGKSFGYTTKVDIVANDEEGMEMGNIQLKYVKALLKCKIVVVAQRDEWEDHYRLYESLASGALVLMDSMLAPPAVLKNKTNVGVYDSLESLESLLHYYLQDSSRCKSVAGRGMKVALGRYRSWHRVEELLFGQPLTQVDQPLKEAPPKMSRPQISFLEGDTVVLT